MELPFSPTFFKKIDIYQQLMGYEKTEPRKSTWKREKIVLSWIVSRENTSRGSRITKNRVKDIIDNKINKNILIEEAQKVLNALGMRGFLDNFDYDEAGVFNRDAYLAGEVLSETKNLAKTTKYSRWIFIWWVVFGSAFIILVSEAFLKLQQLLVNFLNRTSNGL